MKKSRSRKRSVPQLHMAVAAAEKAINRAVRALPASDVFMVAVVAEKLAYGEDRGRWASSMIYSKEREKELAFQDKWVTR